MLKNESEIRRCFNRIGLLDKEKRLTQKLAIKEALYFMTLDDLNYAEYKLNLTESSTMLHTIYGNLDSL